MQHETLALHQIHSCEIPRSPYPSTMLIEHMDVYVLARFGEERTVGRITPAALDELPMGHGMMMLEPTLRTEAVAPLCALLLRTDPHSTVQAASGWRMLGGSVCLHCVLVGRREVAGEGLAEEQSWLCLMRFGLPVLDKMIFLRQSLG